MRKLTFLFALLTLSVGMWAIDGVKYLDANGVEQTANGVTDIEDPPHTTVSAGWYRATYANIESGPLVCQGAVHLILFDGAKFTVRGDNDQAGIQVSGEGNSLTIYAQSLDPEQMGQLIVIGSNDAAGIGGGSRGDYISGSNITINGGKVTVTGGRGGAGIGGGFWGSGSNIIINGGEVTATGGGGAAGIGGGELGSGSDIFVATTHIVKAGDEVIAPTRTATTDIASDLSGKQYVTVKLDVAPYKTEAIDAIDLAIEGVTDEIMLTIANKAKENITAATTFADIIAIKTLALEKLKDLYHILIARQGIRTAEINSMINDAVNGISNATTIDQITALHSKISTIIGLVQTGREEVKEELLGEMGEECTDCTAVEVSDGTTTVTLYKPQKVSYKKIKE